MREPIKKIKKNIDRGFKNIAYYNVRCKLAINNLINTTLIKYSRVLIKITPIASIVAFLFIFIDPLFVSTIGVGSNSNTPRSSSSTASTQNNLPNLSDSPTHATHNSGSQDLGAEAPNGAAAPVVGGWKNLKVDTNIPFVDENQAYSSHEYDLPKHLLLGEDSRYEHIYDDEFNTSKSDLAKKILEEGTKSDHIDDNELNINKPNLDRKIQREQTKAALRLIRERVAEWKSESQKRFKERYDKLQNDPITPEVENIGAQSVNVEKSSQIHIDSSNKISQEKEDAPLVLWFTKEKENWPQVFEGKNVEEYNQFKREFNWWNDENYAKAKEKVKADPDKMLVVVVRSIADRPTDFPDSPSGNYGVNSFSYLIVDKQPLKGREYECEVFESTSDSTPRSVLRRMVLSPNSPTPTQISNSSNLKDEVSQITYSDIEGSIGDENPTNPSTLKDWVIALGIVVPVYIMFVYFRNK